MQAASERLTLMRAFGDRLQELRRVAELTPSKLARRCRVSASAISDVERGRSEASLSLILALCDGLGISPDVLLVGLPVPKKRRTA
jgi:transcriptional regulator with XRE-family HTH domain